MIDLDYLTTRDAEAIANVHEMNCTAPYWDSIMSSPCPCCGAFRMTLGYYIHLGACDACADAEFRTFSSLR